MDMFPLIAPATGGGELACGGLVEPRL
jgi:hypothetical protein